MKVSFTHCIDEPCIINASSRMGVSIPALSAEPPTLLSFISFLNFPFFLPLALILMNGNCETGKRRTRRRARINSRSDVRPTRHVPAIVLVVTDSNRESHE